jgi:hypothetical protein
MFTPITILVAIGESLRFAVNVSPMVLFRHEYPDAGAEPLFRNPFRATFCGWPITRLH